MEEAVKCPHCGEKINVGRLLGQRTSAAKAKAARANGRRGGRRTFAQKLVEARAILDDAIHRYKPSHVFAMFSGGHDSLSVTHFASQHSSFSGAIHINTGIGVEQTREFVRSTCQHYGWKLIERSARAGQYEEWVTRFGFPGPSAHRYMYSLLKERPLRTVIREFKRSRHDRILLVTGVRRQESARRMGHVQAVQQEGVRVWCAPFLRLSALDVGRYLEENRVQRNEVVDILHMSGECGCGAYGKQGELQELEVWFPDLATRIRALEAKVRAAGHSWGWGWEARSCSKKVSQAGSTFQPMCVGCAKTSDKA